VEEEEADEVVVDVAVPAEVASDVENDTPVSRELFKIFEFKLNSKILESGTRVNEPLKSLNSSLETGLVQVISSNSISLN
jgi:hypothetical protein